MQRNYLDIFKVQQIPPSKYGFYFTILTFVITLGYTAYIVYQYETVQIDDTKLSTNDGCVEAVFECANVDGCLYKLHGTQTILRNGAQNDVTYELANGVIRPFRMCVGNGETIEFGAKSNSWTYPVKTFALFSRDLLTADSDGSVYRIASNMTIERVYKYDGIGLNPTDYAYYPEAKATYFAVRNMSVNRPSIVEITRVNDAFIARAATYVAGATYIPQRIAVTSDTIYVVPYSSTDSPIYKIDRVNRATLTYADSFATGTILPQAIAMDADSNAVYYAGFTVSTLSVNLCRYSDTCVSVVYPYVVTVHDLMITSNRVYIFAYGGAGSQKPLIILAFEKTTLSKVGEVTVASATLYGKYVVIDDRVYVIAVETAGRTIYQFDYASLTYVSRIDRPAIITDITAIANVAGSLAYAGPKSATESTLVVNPRSSGCTAPNGVWRIQNSTLRFPQQPCLYSNIITQTTSISVTNTETNTYTYSDSGIDYTGRYTCTINTQKECYHMSISYMHITEKTQRAYSLLSGIGAIGGFYAMVVSALSVVYAVIRRMCTSADESNLKPKLKSIKRNQIEEINFSALPEVDFTATIQPNRNVVPV